MSSTTVPTTSTRAPRVAPLARREGGRVRPVRLLLGGLFIAALPLLIISSTLRWLVTDRAFMLDGFLRNGVARTTGLDGAQLERVADAFVQYFAAPPGRLDVRVERGGQSAALFNEREILHMEDVQALIQGFLRAGPIAATLVLLRVLYAASVERTTRPLGRDLLLSNGFVVLLIVLVGGAAAADFTTLWTQFHRVAFRNDLWLLDPRTDALIQLFPEPAWYAYTLRMVGATAAATLLTGTLGVLLLRRRAARGRHGA